MSDRLNEATGADVARALQSRSAALHEPHPASTCDAFPLAVGLTLAQRRIEQLEDAGRDVATYAAIFKIKERAGHDLTQARIDLTEALTVWQTIIDRVTIPTPDQENQKCNDQ